LLAHFIPGPSACGAGMTWAGNKDGTSQDALGTGLLVGRAATSLMGADGTDSGVRLESLVRAGLTGPMAEALAMYYQVSPCSASAVTVLPLPERP
jgi:hypothetical protein